MKKLFVISVISIIAMMSNFAGDAVVTSVSGDGGKSQYVTVNATCTVYAFTYTSTYGSAVVYADANHKIINYGQPGVYNSVNETWNGTWTTIQIAAYAASGGPNTPIGANTAGIHW
jgi:hypothetical protein